MRIKPGDMVEWTGALSSGAPWHFIGRYKGSRKGAALVEMRNGAVLTVERKLLKNADE